MSSCCLDTNDLAGVPTGLQNSQNMWKGHVELNQLTDEFVISLLQFAAWRSRVTEQQQVSLPWCKFGIGKNNISEASLMNLAFILPALCNIRVTDCQNIGHHLHVSEGDIAQLLRKQSQRSTDVHMDFVLPGLGDHEGHKVAHFLTTDYASHLRTFDLCQSDIGNSAVAAIAENLPQTRLHGLDLSGNLLTMLGFHKLLVESAAGSSLQYLNVAKTRYSPAMHFFQVN